MLRYANPDKICLETAAMREGRERRRRKVQERCEQENLQYASISAKLELLETRLTAKENESIDKVVYAKRHEDGPSDSASEANINLSLGHIENERKSLEEKISGKL